MSSYKKCFYGAATLLFLSLAVLGWLFNLIVFLIEEFNMKSIAAAQITNIVSGCTFMFPVVGAIAADSFFGTIPVSFSFHFSNGKVLKTNLTFVPL